MDTTDENINRDTSDNLGLEDTQGIIVDKQQNINYKLGGVTGKGFMPGVSGNPAGRPKGQTLKEFQAEVFRTMSIEEKKEWLKDIAKDTRWKMAEGNPKQDVEANVKGELKIEISEDIAKKYDTTPDPEDNSPE